jgi:hypothetical protein
MLKTNIGILVLIAIDGELYDRIKGPPFSIRNPGLLNTN